MPRRCNFFGWAIKEVIDNWSDKVKKIIRNSDNEEDMHHSDEHKSHTILKSMQCFHNHILSDDEYICECYPIAIVLQNCGWMCLVSKPYFALGQTLLQKF